MKLVNNLNKKAENMGVDSLLLFVILFLILAITLSLGTDILTSIQDTQDNDESTLANNESLTWAGNATAITSLQETVIASSVILYNNGSIVNNPNDVNYTVVESNHSIIIYNVSANYAWVTNALNITYSFHIGSAQRNITGQGITTQITLAKWTPTIALVIIIAIIIGILITYLARRFSN